MTNGNISQEAAPGETSEGFTVPTMALPKTMDGYFEQAFPDVISFVEKTYRVKKDKGTPRHRRTLYGWFPLALHLDQPSRHLRVHRALLCCRRPTAKGGLQNIYADREKKIDQLFARHPRLFWIGISKTDFLYKNNADPEVLSRQQTLSLRVSRN